MKEVMPNKNLIIEINEKSNIHDIENTISKLNEYLKDKVEELFEAFKYNDSKKIENLLQFFKNKRHLVTDKLLEGFKLEIENEESLKTFDVIVHSEMYRESRIFKDVMNENILEFFGSPLLVEKLIKRYPEQMEDYINETWEDFSPSVFIHCFDNNHIKANWNLKDYFEHNVNLSVFRWKHSEFLENKRFNDCLKSKETFIKLITVIWDKNEIFSDEKLKEIHPDMSIFDILQNSYLKKTYMLKCLSFEKVSMLLSGFLQDDKIKQDTEDKIKMLANDLIKTNSAEKINLFWESLLNINNQKLILILNEEIKKLPNNNASTMWKKMHNLYEINLKIKKIPNHSKINKHKI